LGFAKAREPSKFTKIRKAKNHGRRKKKRSRGKTWDRGD